MPRKKRAERLLGQESRPEPTRATTGAVAQRIISFICPVCGKAGTQFRAIKSGYATVDQLRYFESIDWDPRKPFGVSYAAGSLADWHYIEPDDAPELFEAVKKRFLDAIKEWKDKGWITEEELKEVM